jgi:hypothetical protein
MVDQKVMGVWRRENGVWRIEISDTISCIELTMRHDKRGRVIGWMEGEPKTDNWDGAIDNRIRILEDKGPERVKFTTIKGSRSS